jgi:hypothetical protein
MRDENPIERYTLFTNLSFVTVNGVRTFTHALLLQDTGSFTGEGRDVRLRGFGTDELNPTFNIGVRAPEYELGEVAGDNRFLMASDDGELKPISSGTALRLGDLVVGLAVDDQRKPICVDKFEAPQNDSPVLQVWNVLARRVAEHWTAPAIPHTSFTSTRVRRIILGAR